MQFAFDATNVAPNLGFAPVPDGIYTCNISAQEVVPVKDGGGQYLKIEWQITEGQYTGRKFYDRLNMWNSNPQAVEIAYGTMSAILRATGKMRYQDTSELLGQTCKVEVKIVAGGVNKQTGEQYEPQNRIKAYHSMSGQPLNQIGGAPAAGGAMPWAQQGAPAPAAPVAAPVAQGQPSWATGAPQLAPPPAASVPVVPASPQPIKRLTAKAGGATLEQFLGGGWTEQAMIEQGYLEVIAPAPAAPVAPPAAPVAPAFVPPAQVAPAAPAAAPAAWQPPTGAVPTMPGAGPVAPWARAPGT